MPKFVLPILAEVLNERLLLASSVWLTAASYAPGAGDLLRPPAFSRVVDEPKPGDRGLVLLDSCASIERPLKS